MKLTQGAIDTARAMFALIIEEIRDNGVQNLKQHEKTDLQDAFKVLRAGKAACDEETIGMLKEAGLLSEPPGQNGAGAGTGPVAGPSGGMLAAEIARLGALSPVEYDRVRDWEAKRLGMRMKTLDDAVKKIRCGKAVPDPGDEKRRGLKERNKEKLDLGWVINSRGRLVNCAANALHWLENEGYGERLAYNELAGRIFLDGQAADENDKVQIKIVLEKYTGYMAWTDKFVEQGLDILGQRRRYHPVRDWMNSLSWDETKRINSLCGDVLNADNSEINIQIIRKWLISGVARSMRPGCKVDHALVLIEAKGGVGKSKFGAAIVPNDEWFGSITHFGSDRDAAMALAGKLIIEYPEASALSRKELGEYKAFLSNSIDVHRKPWDREAGDYPRSCIFLISANEASPMRYEDSNRRFWPIHVPTASAFGIDILIENREQIWAEAVAAYKAGEKWWFTFGEEPEGLVEIQRDLTDLSDTWEDILARSGLFADGREITQSDGFEILRIDAARQDRASQMRLGRIYLRNGFTKTQVMRDRRRFNVYHPPATNYTT